MRKLVLLAALALVACFATRGVASAQCCDQVCVACVGAPGGTCYSCSTLSSATKPGNPSSGPMLNGCIETPAGCVGGILLDGSEKELIDGCLCIGSGANEVCIANDGMGNPAKVDLNQCRRAAANECNEGLPNGCGGLIGDTDFSPPMLP